MTGTVDIAFFENFLPALTRLPNTVQNKTNAFIKKFQTDPTGSGINFERINNAANPGYRSVRINKAYRAILLKPEVGNQYVMLWVGHHDDAYDWAVRTTVRVNPRTNVLQVYPVLRTEIVDTDGADADFGSRAAALAERVGPPSEPSAPDSVGADPLFSLDESQLTGVGVPDTHVALVETLASRAALDDVKSLLPIEAYEALALFADGMDWNEVWEVYGPSSEPVDTDDILTALNQPGSQRQFHVVESEQELARMLEEPLAKWRVFLHPSQRQLVERDRNGPVRVTGGAGTGKTVVAMHRAVRLARRAGPSERPSVLFLTFNTNLAKDIAASIAGMESTEVIRRIEVTNIDAWLWRALRSVRYGSKLRTERDLEGMLDTAIASPGVQGLTKSDGGAFPRSFFLEEWARVILPQRIRDAEQYLRADRAGRGVALSRRQRASLWPVFGELRESLSDGGGVVRSDATLDARDLLASGRLDAGYRHVVVDETQDMGAEALQLIRAIVPEGTNDLFFVGDGHQRIYGRAAAMKHSGIHIVGRSFKLRINYRTTEEIRRFAVALMDGTTVDDLDGGVDDGREYLSLTNGPMPTLVGADDQEGEIDLIVERLQALQAKAVPLESCCVMLRAGWLRDRFAASLRDRGIGTVVLEKEADDPDVPGVRVANMHRVKGLEFQHVFMAAMNEGIVPSEAALRSTEDKVERRELERAERSLAHVCATRAIESLMISWHGTPSEYVRPAR